VGLIDFDLGAVLSARGGIAGVQADYDGTSYFFYMKRETENLGLRRREAINDGFDVQIIAILILI
jgi:hypothetical protein